MEYLLKSGKQFSESYKFNYEKPSVCPHCGIGTDAPIKSKNIFVVNGRAFISAICQCTSCQKDFFFSCISNGKDFAKNVCLYPPVSFTPYKNEIHAKISERFIDMYNQALQSEFVGNIELAAIGYRSALEILIKDFAITELGKPKNEVSGKKLFKAIEDYLGQTELINTADVIRILGNDYTHYDRKYPQHDFDLLKGYMDIFLKQIEYQYMIKHPPVSRTP